MPHMTIKGKPMYISEEDFSQIESLLSCVKDGVITLEELANGLEKHYFRKTLCQLPLNLEE